MRDILMSIKPQYSQAILRGEKTIEFRRVFMPAFVDCRRVIIYESAPTQMIVGSFEIQFNHYGSLDTKVDAMEKTEMILRDIDWSVAGISEAELRKYFSGAKNPCAIYLQNVVKLEKPFKPKDSDPKFLPPQSYMWCPEWLSMAVHTILENQKKAKGGT